MSIQVMKGTKNEQVTSCVEVVASEERPTYLLTQYIILLDDQCIKN
jgi:hypothetical protein